MRVSGRGMLAGVLVLLVATVCVRLGFWQLDRLDQRRERNAAVAAALAAPRLELDGGQMAAVAAEPHRYRYRRVRVTGEYEHTGSILLRGRGRQGTPGVHLVAPLRVGGGDTAVLVNRGWLPAPDAATVDPRPYREAGSVVVEGMVDLPPAPSPNDDPRAVTVRVNGVEVPTYQRLDLPTLRDSTGLVLLPFYIERTSSGDGEDALPLGMPPPRLDDGPHLGYAVQWFGFAAVALGGFLVAVLRSGRRA